MRNDPRQWRLAGWLTLLVGFFAGVLAAGLWPMLGATLWLLSWAAAATLFVGARMVRYRREPLDQATLEERASYQAALEAARAELERFET